MALRSKRTLGILTLLACVTALCLALGACSGGGGGGNAPSGGSAFAGKWMMYETTEGGEVINYDQADPETKALMEQNTIVFSDDGTMSISDDGQDIEGTWEATGETIGTALVNDMTFTLAIDGDMLTIVNPQGASMTMKRIE